MLVLARRFISFPMDCVSVDEIRPETAWCSWTRHLLFVQFKLFFVDWDFLFLPTGLG